MAFVSLRIEDAKVSFKDFIEAVSAEPSEPSLTEISTLTITEPLENVTTKSLSEYPGNFSRYKRLTFCSSIFIALVS
jgi:hypothetical protein